VDELSVLLIVTLLFLVVRSLPYYQAGVNFAFAHDLRLLIDHLRVTLVR